VNFDLVKVFYAIAMHLSGNSCDILLGWARSFNLVIFLFRGMNASIFGSLANGSGKRHRTHRQNRDRHKITVWLADAF